MERDKERKHMATLHRLLGLQEVQLIKQKLQQDCMENYFGQEREVSLKDSLKYLLHSNNFDSRLTTLVNEARRHTALSAEGEHSDRPRHNLAKLLQEKKIEWTNQLYDVLVDLSKNKEIKTKIVYTCLSFYEFLRTIHKEERPHRFMHEIRSPQVVRVCGTGKDYQDLKEKYRALRKNKQVEHNETEQKELLFEEIIGGDCEPDELRDYLKSGSPHSKRVELYLNVFEVEDEQRKEVGELLQGLDNHSFAKFFEQIILQDIQTSLRSELYFQFEQMITKVFKGFCKDQSIRQSIFDDVFSEEEKEKITANGVIPFCQMSLWVGPFCFTSQNEEIVYLLYREFFTRFFSRLVTISTEEEHIIGLCNLFESLVLQKDEDLVICLRNHGKYIVISIEVRPLDLGFPWIFHCFVNFLAVDQQFLLFDRIVGYQSLQIVAVLAAAVVLSRKAGLRRARRKQQVLDLYACLDDIIFIDTIKTFFEP